MSQPDTYSKISITKLPSFHWQKFKLIRLRALKEEPQAFSTSLFEEECKFKEDYWKNILDQSEKEEGNFLLFALNGEEILGMIGAKFESNYKINHVAVIHSFYVRPECRGNGIGHSLITKVLEEIESKNHILKTRLLVNTEQISAINLYKEFNFREVGLLKDEIKIGERFYNKIIMERKTSKLFSTFTTEKIRIEKIGR